KGGGPEARRRRVRGSRLAYSTGCPAKARAVTSNGSPGSPSSANRPFFVPTRSCVISPSSSRDRRQDVDPVVRPDRRVLLAGLTVDEDVDVPPEGPALVEDPAAQRRPVALERAQQLADGRARERVLGAAAGELLQRSTQRDD